MAYNATYVADDMDDIVIDGLGTFGVVIVSFITLIALVFLYNWFRGKKTKSFH